MFFKFFYDKIITVKKVLTMEEFNISEFLQFLKKHLFFLVTMIIMVFFICFLYFFIIKQPMYSSSVQLTLSGVSDEEEKITTTDITLNTKMLPTYQEVITSRSVLERVILNLKLDRSLESLADNIKISAVTDSMVLTITVTDSSAIIAKNIANEIAEIFSEEIQRLYNITNITFLDKAIINNTPINVNYIKSGAISIFCSLFFAFGSLFIVFYLDKTVKSAEQVATQLNMIVLGGVPFHIESSKRRKKNRKAKKKNEK